MTKFNDIVKTRVDNEDGMFELISVVSLGENSEKKEPVCGFAPRFINGHRFELIVLKGKYKGTHYVYDSGQVERMIKTLREEESLSLDLKQAS